MLIGYLTLLCLIWLMQKQMVSMHGERRGNPTLPKGIRIFDQLGQLTRVFSSAEIPLRAILLILICQRVSAVEICVDVNDKPSYFLT